MKKQAPKQRRLPQALADRELSAIRGGAATKENIVFTSVSNVLSNSAEPRPGGAVL